MARNTPWRKECPSIVRTRQDCGPRIFLLRQTGPAAFVLKDEGHRKPVQVRLGDPHECSCHIYRKERELCPHLCWTLVKKLGIKPEDPLSFQQGLVSLELESVLQGSHRSKPKQKVNVVADPVPRRPISPRDVCPICLENLIKARRPVTRCRYGCGRPVHVACMVVLSQFHTQDLNEGSMLKCPMCRGKFSSWNELQKEKQRLQRKRCIRFPPLVPPPVPTPILHAGATCKACLKSPVLGPLYRCSQCPLVLMCSECVTSAQGEMVRMLHRQHGLSVKLSPWDRWRTVQSTSDIRLPVLNTTSTKAQPKQHLPDISLPAMNTTAIKTQPKQHLLRKQLIPEFTLNVQALSLTQRSSGFIRKSGGGIY